MNSHHGEQTEERIAEIKELAKRFDRRADDCGRMTECVRFLLIERERLREELAEERSRTKADASCPYCNDPLGA